MSAPSRTDLTIRRFGPQDEDEVLDLLRASLGAGPAGSRPAEFFRWKHAENPFGSSYLLVGEAGGRIVGLRAFLRWRFRLGDRSISAVRAVDTATHPDEQGRGVFKRLTLRALDDLRDDVDLVFNTPNRKSLTGYLGMGWRPVGTVRIAVRIRRPTALARGRRGSLRPPPSVDAPPAATIVGKSDAVAGLLQAEDEAVGRLRTDRTPDYLRWRYGSAPLLDYRAVVSGSGGAMDGLAVFRVRPRRGMWEATVAELIVPGGDVGGARRLLREVARSAPVDVLTCRMPPGTASARALRRGGFVPAPGGMTLVVNSLRPIGIDPQHPGSWALRLGDLEVF